MDDDENRSTALALDVVRRLRTQHPGRGNDHLLRDVAVLMVLGGEDLACLVLGLVDQLPDDLAEHAGRLSDPTAGPDRDRPHDAAAPRSPA